MHLNKTCFVVMGYGEKKIQGTNIKLDLDEIYFKFIKPVLINNNLKSIYFSDTYRGDEVPTSEAINKNFLRSIFLADIVIADISTLNQNAIYELGLRHAMKPKSTIILCDTKTADIFNFFDISMQPQLRYDSNKLCNDEKYMYEKQEKLEKIIQNCINSSDTYIDSPIFDLNLYNITPNITLQDINGKYVSKSLRELLDDGNNFLNDNKFKEAEECFKNILKISFDLNIFSNYVLSMYKKEISIGNLTKTLHYINSKVDLDTITHEDLLGISGAIHKRLFELTKDHKHFDFSIAYYKRGSDYEAGNLYCARNYCAMLLKKYLLTKDKDQNREYFYTAVHNAKLFITKSRIIKKEYTNLDDNWYNSNMNDLLFIASGKYSSITTLENSNKRQKSTIEDGIIELMRDYNGIKECIV